MIIIATHTVYLKGKDIYGPPHAVSLYLNKNKKNHIFIKHTLDGDFLTRIEYFKKGKKVKVTEKKLGKSPFFLKYLAEMFLNLRVVFQTDEPLALFIGVDPLNAMAGVLLKFVRKTKKTVYFSADFADKRFGNSIMNTVYLWLDKQAMYLTDQTWSISKRITAYRKKQGLPANKNKLLPNAPFFHEIKREPYSRIHRHHLVLVARLTEGIAFDLLFDAIDGIRKKYPKIKLSIIGSGPMEKKLQEYVLNKHLTYNIKFHGPLSHDDMFTVLVKSGIGIALYNFSAKDHYHYYSDSMKVRDYLASGLPVIVSGNSAIIDEVKKYNVGTYVTLDKRDIASAIQSYLANEKKYLQYRKNAISLAETYDTYALLEKYLHDE